MESAFFCPISKCIFLNPVTLEDGHTYERHEITQWLSKNNISPITREPIHASPKHLNVNILVKQMIETYLNDHPHMRIQQYVEPVLFTDTAFDALDNANAQKKYLLACPDIASTRVIQYLCETADMALLTFLMEENVWASPLRLGWKLVHYICKWAPDRLDERFESDMECACADGVRPIHFMCHSGRPDKVRFLVELGADIESATMLGYRPIHFICESGGSVELLLYLLDKGADMESETNMGERPLCIACYSYNTYPLAAVLISKGANVNAGTNAGIRPIHRACRNANINLIMLLLSIPNIELNCAAYMEDAIDVYPIHLLCKHLTLKQPKIIQAIRVAKQRGMNIDVSTTQFIHPICLLCKYAPAEFIEELIDDGVNFEKEMYSGTRPIHILARRTSVDPNYRTQNTNVRAISSLVKRLIQQGVRTELADKHGVRLIHILCEYAGEDLIRFAFQQGIDVDCATTDGMRPIHYLCFRQFYSLVRELVYKKVNINATTILGISPIHILLNQSPINPDLVCEFIDNGANVVAPQNTRQNDASRRLHVYPELLRYALDVAGVQPYAYTPPQHTMDMNIFPYTWFNEDDPEED